MAVPLARTSALLCGGTAGIGLSTAKALIKAGVPQLMLVSRTAARGEAALDALKREGVDVRFAAHDVTTAQGAVGAVAAAHESFGKIDLLVNTGGGTG